jgi:hypothetical protein
VVPTAASIQVSVAADYYFQRVIGEIRRVQCLKTLPEEHQQLFRMEDMLKIIHERLSFRPHDYQLDGRLELSSLSWTSKP